MQRIVKLIRDDVKLHGKCTLFDDQDVIDFRRDHPKLYDMIIRSDCDDSILFTMINLYSKIETGSISREDGDKIMGEVAAEKYVMPLVHEKRD